MNFSIKYVNILLSDSSMPNLDFLLILSSTLINFFIFSRYVSIEMKIKVLLREMENSLSSQLVLHRLS